MTNPDTIAVIVGEMRKVAQCLRGVSYLVSKEVDALAARLAALGDVEKDAARYRWLKDRLMSASFEDDDCVGLTFDLPAGSTVWACTDRTIDAAMQPKDPDDD